MTLDPAKPCAALCLPDVAGKSAAKAGLIAMQVDVQFPPAKRDWVTFARRALQTNSRAVVFWDISPSCADVDLNILQLAEAFPAPDLRSRILLTRQASGHVSTADQSWVRRLGFAGLWGHFDSLDCEGELGAALNHVAVTLQVERPPPDTLARYVRVLHDDRAPVSARSTISTITGCTAETLAGVLHRKLDIGDRTFRLRQYPHCFIGSEAVSWIARNYRCNRAGAVAIGRALVKLGLLIHVTHEQPFDDAQYFYRLAHSAPQETLELDATWTLLRSERGVSVRDRSHLGRTFRHCWVASEAVSLLADRFRSTRFAAWLVLHRLMQFNLIEHVTRDRPFVDGAFFYRFAGGQP